MPVAKRSYTRIQDQDDANTTLNTATDGRGLAYDHAAGKFTLPTTLKADTIAETTSATGVTVDGVLLKDAAITILRLPAATELTINAGAITITQSRHTIDTEANAITDDLNTINGGSDGQLLFLYSDAGRTIVVKHNVGNITLNGNADVTLDWQSDLLQLVYIAALSRWLQISLAEQKTWSLEDQFTTTLAAGSINSTSAEPGPGTRTVTDTESKLAIT